MVQSIVLLKSVELLIQFEAVEEGIPSVLLIADLLFKLSLYELRPVLLTRDLINHFVVVFEAHVELPCWFLFGHCLLDFLFFEVLTLKLLTLLLRQLNFLNLWRFLGPYTLELDGSSLVVELWD